MSKLLAYPGQHEGDVDATKKTELCTVDSTLNSP